jgi:hypothetical protein
VRARVNIASGRKVHHRLYAQLFLSNEAAIRVKVHNSFICRSKASSRGSVLD